MEGSIAMESEAREGSSDEQSNNNGMLRDHRQLDWPARSVNMSMAMLKVADGFACE